MVSINTKTSWQKETTHQPPPTNHKFLRLLAVLALFWLASCTPATETAPRPPAETATLQEVAPTIGAPTTSGPAVSNTPEDEQSPLPLTPAVRLPVAPVEREGVAPKVEIPADAVNTAIGHLAGRLNIKASDIADVYLGKWTDAPVGCELDLADPRQELLLQGEHVHVDLTYKGRVYAYWVFRSGAGQFLAVPCRAGG